MQISWNCGAFLVQKRDDRFYQVFFETQDAIDFVLTNGPWNYDNSLVLARPRLSASLVLPRDLDKEYSWLLLTRLPRFCYMMDVGVKLGRSLNSCKVLQLHEDPVHGAKYFRFRVLVCITKPLKRMHRIVTLDGGSHMGLIKYEPLLTFCFICGLIGHRYCQCEQPYEAKMEVKTMPYGSWMGGIDNMHSNLICFIEDFDVVERDVPSTDLQAMGVGGRVSSATSSVQTSAGVHMTDISHQMVSHKGHKTLQTTPKKRHNSDGTFGNSSSLTTNILKWKKLLTAEVASRPRLST